MHKSAFLTLSIEFKHSLLAECYFSFAVCMNSPVFSNMSVISRSVPKSLLTNKNFTCIDGLTTKSLYATTFCDAISAVICRPTGLFMCHIDEILQGMKRFARKYYIFRCRSCTSEGKWLRGLDSNQRPRGYEPRELPGCSTPRRASYSAYFRAHLQGNSLKVLF